MLTDLALPVQIVTRGGRLSVRRATRRDGDSLTELLADDAISDTRGDTAQASDLPAYLRALSAILQDPANDLVIAANADDVPIAMLQLTRIPGMARRGATRLLVEAVRVRSDSRSSGVGTALMKWVLESAAPALRVELVQLTSDAARVDAHRFYERLGFVASHVGFKYVVAPTN